MSSLFLHHTNCPSCGSKDNLGVFDDDHTYCFGCGYYTPGKTKMNKIHENCPVVIKDSKTFPEDATYYIPTEPMKWLLKNGITHTTQTQFGIQWSPSQELVCWKIGTIGWQGRCFKKDAKTKYISHGKIHEILSILNLPKIDTSTFHANTIVLVEDYLSAIRISFYLPCLPLFGCTINLELLTKLSKKVNKIIIWLDSDKLDNARKIAANLQLIGLKSQVIYTSKDPKEYSDEEIKQYLETING